MQRAGATPRGLRRDNCDAGHRVADGSNSDASESEATRESISNPFVDGVFSRIFPST
jgi:hypothetical protein|tara:strand:- start:743 stop:913 length:171 start_codon:yes stop_codon:yes gene_type:complete